MALRTVHSVMAPACGTSYVAERSNQVERLSVSAELSINGRSRCMKNICSSSAFKGKSLQFRSSVQSSSTTSTSTLRIEAAKRVTSGRNLVLSTTLVAEEGSEEKVQQLCQDVLKWAHEKKTDKKSGVLHFECNTDPHEKNVFHFWERYDSFTSMNDVRASKEHCDFMNEVRPLLTGPVGLAAYEYQDGKIGHMLNPIGPKGEGGLDDATGQGGSGGGASYKQTSAGMQQGGFDREAWGMEKMLEQQQNAVENAAKNIAEGLKTLFGGKKKE